MADWRRTHTCGDLRAEQVGQEVVLNGWVHGWRDHGGLVFIDLRDRFGLTQVVFDPDAGAAMHELARGLRSEFVISVRGKVVARLEGKTNPKLPTGQIEVRATELLLLNRCESLPFDVTAENDLAGEELRLRYRYLDLRRPAVQEVMVLRHRINQVMRGYLSDRGFVEVETPILGRSTPEGARDYLVPSRVQPGSWYALPQSPQLYKQILMVAGLDKYFQIARCFRDEDLRANRQPEFTQLDVEMSFVEADDVMGVMEGLVCQLMKEIKGVELATPFPRMTYAEAMERFGSDKPDLRYGLELKDIAPLAKATEFAVFQRAECVRGLRAPQAADKFSRKQLDELTAFVGELGAKGLAWIKVEPGKLNSPIAKFFSAEQQQDLLNRMEAAPGDLLLFVAGPRESTHAPLAALRARLARELALYDPASYHFSWCVEFPMFERDAESGRWDAKHHPFTALLDEDWSKLDQDPGSVRAKAYDLIVNGEEAGGGTIRLHQPQQQRRIFELLGMNEEVARARFGFLLDALRFGAPPHGGIALGIDRWVMLLSGLDNIRECIAFPKTQRAADLMTGAPAPVEVRQLRELGLK